MDKNEKGEGQDRHYPVPDPTVLTTEALLREVKQLKELLRAETSGTKGIYDERFNAVAKQFELVEQGRIEQKLDTKAAVDAALIAQKEAVKEQTLASERAISKNEAATTKQLDQQSVGFVTSIKGVTDQVNDVKDRITRLEGGRTGGTERSQNVNTVIIAILSIITIGSVILGVLQRLGK